MNPVKIVSYHYFFLVTRKPFRVLSRLLNVA